MRGAGSLLVVGMVVALPSGCVRQPKIDVDQLVCNSDENCPKGRACVQNKCVLPRRSEYDAAVDWPVSSGGSDVRAVDQVQSAGDGYLRPVDTDSDAPVPGSGGAPGNGGAADVGAGLRTGGVFGAGGASGRGGIPGAGGSGTVAAAGGSLGTGGVILVGGATSVSGKGGAATSTGGRYAMGGIVGSGGASSRGGVTGTGGIVGTGGSPGTGGAPGTGGTPGTGGAPGTGGTPGTGGAPPSTGPCDIYAAGSTPCVAAYSMVRVLLSTYTGPLYQVRKGGTGGTTRDIGSVSGFADAASQDAFCGADACSMSMLYDQSGRGNHLTVAPAGCFTGTASEPDYESDAKARSLTVGGRQVYALKMKAHDGYRNNAGSSIPTGNASQGIYEVVDGNYYGTACCWDFGNVSTDNCSGATGHASALFFGVGYWGRGEGNGPWFMGDFAAGVWSGGSGASNTLNPDNPSMKIDFAMGILKTSTNSGIPKYAIRVGNAQSGTLTTAYDGTAPATWALQGGIVLGIAGDNSNLSYGTFFEGAITAGRPSDATDAAILQNVQAVGYGQ